MIRFGLFILVLCGTLLAQSATPAANTTNAASSPTTPTAKSAKTKAAPAGKPEPILPNRPPRRATMYYEGMWGVDSLAVKYAESGEIIRFSYRVVDPEKAKTLNDKKLEPSLIDEEAHVKLVVPSLEKVGALRQASTPEAGKTYWMAFSNRGRPVKKGHHVDVVIGSFRAQGLIVN
ncbi:MAG TPA: hypothetical protein VKV39_08180 [Candidatus Sulfotelmatobacter sp.]|nr:hypothetical protein [Candidatus Sulfotelmatobacter sp.]